MGIRFYCPNGHKLNVKSFQAGRRGICPFCGAKIIIPSQSTRKSSKAERATRGGAAEAEHEIVLQPEPAYQPAPAARHAAPLPEAGAGDRGAALGAVSPGAPVPGGVPPMATPVATPASTSAAPRQAPVTAAPLAAGNAGATPIGEAQFRPVQPAETQPAPEFGTQVPTASPASATAAEPPDPLAEAGNVVWYVRPPSGGQFGPATSDVMRTWIGEGRVSSDSLVWREGWRDWQEASGVFPQLGASKDEFGIDVLDPAESTTKAALGRARAPRSRRQETVQQASIITLLILAVFVLVGVFVWVVVYYPG